MGGERLVVLTVLNVAAALPCLAVLALVPLPAPAAWPYLLASVAIHVAYYCFLAAAYGHGDLSRVYPLARGLSPLLVAAGAAAWLGEPLGGVALAGALVTCAGLASLAFEHGPPWRGDPRGVLYATGTAVLIAAYTVVDGTGVRLSGTAAGYIAWLFVLDALPLAIWVALRRRAALRATLRAEWRKGLGGGALQLSAYGLVIWAMSIAPLALVSALRETSVLFAAFIGARLLGEPVGTTRIAAAGAVTAGIVILRAGF